MKNFQLNNIIIVVKNNFYLNTTNKKLFMAFFLIWTSEIQVNPHYILLLWNIHNLINFSIKQFKSLIISDTNTSINDLGYVEFYLFINPIKLKLIRLD